MNKIYESEVFAVVVFAWPPEDPQTAPRTAEQQAQPSAQAIEASVMIRLMARAQRPQRMLQPRQP
jgi:hypothetical protein